MKKVALGLLVILVIAIGAGGGYFYFSVYKPMMMFSAVDQEVETAIFSKDNMAAAHIDIKQITKIHEIAYGLPLENEVQKYKLPESTPLGEWQTWGMDPRKDLDSIFVGLSLVRDQPRWVMVLTGSFDPTLIRKRLNKEYQAEVENWGAFKLYSVSRQDQETCKQKGPYAVYVDVNRVVISQPEHIKFFLTDLVEGPKLGSKDLSDWQKFRKDQMASFYIKVPEKFPKIKGSMYGAMAGGFFEKLKNYESFMLAAGIDSKKWSNLFSPDLMIGQVSTQINFKNPELGKAEITKYKTKWKEQTKSLEGSLKSFAKLYDHMEDKFEGKAYKTKINFGPQLIQDIKGMFSEGISKLVGGSIGGSIGGSKKGSNDSKPKEKLAKNLTNYPKSFSVKSLPKATLKNSQGTDFHAVSGPFGLRVSEIKVPDADSGEIEFSIRAEADKLMSIGRSPELLKLYIDSIKLKNGKEGLKKEACGRDRNHKAAKFIGFQSRYSTDKKVRTIPKLKLNEVREILGHIDFEIPTRIVEKVIPAKEGSSVEFPGGKLVVRAVESSQVRYDIYGDSSKIIELRGLNAKGQALEKGWSMSSGFMWSEGTGKNQSFVGKVMSLKVIFAQESSVQKYSFKLKKWWPHPFWGDVLQKPEGEVKKLSRQDFDKIYSKGRTGPFSLHGFTLEKGWIKGARFKFKFEAPKLEGLAESPSALKLRFDKVVLKDGRVVTEQAPLEESGTTLGDKFRSGSLNMFQPLQWNHLIRLRNRGTHTYDQNAKKMIERRGPFYSQEETVDLPVRVDKEKIKEIHFSIMLALPNNTQVVEIKDPSLGAGFEGAGIRGQIIGVSNTDYSLKLDQGGAGLMSFKAKRTADNKEVFGPVVSKLKDKSYFVELRNYGQFKSLELLYATGFLKRRWPIRYVVP